ncbi:MAG: hypothetical protein K6T81_11155 [Alicyclobacillus macrosporangiidus]|uniref:hypothetical protein n=1 Tax=Alicyclobacillus macrosporangiidus TaxID=392015 RepID=UPI0026EECCE5|nr:hypothetical protein [Alicyclobacillus macrosporangiidus]MCL6599282.1 hypothetical protein [Alicyclobacillus macrosporangiidus]
MTRNIRCREPIIMCAALIRGLAAGAMVGAVVGAASSAFLLALSWSIVQVAARPPLGCARSFCRWPG